MSTPSSIGDLGEHGLIDLIRQRVGAPPAWVAVGIGDDAAVLEPARNRLEVVTTDALIEGVHFDRAFTPPAAIGHRALAVNLSDLAAMGATPRAALLSLALPPAFPADDVSQLLDGFLLVAGLHGVALVGGNVSTSPGPVFVDVTAIGSIRRRRVLTRGGARPGHEIWLSGSVGAAAAGLACLQAAGTPPDWMAACVSRYLRPDPRVRLGTLLGGNRAATACVDLSDGLADGLRQVADASLAGVVIEGAAVPVDAAARRWFELQGQDPLQRAMTGGDDYELLFTVSPRHRGRMAAARRHAGGLALTRIGVLTADRALIVRHGGRDLPLADGYLHFR